MAIDNILQHLTLFVTALTPIVLALIARRAAQHAASAREDAAAQNAAANDKLDSIHTAVNSERSAMLDKLEALHEEVRRLQRLVDQPKEAPP